MASAGNKLLWVGCAVAVVGGALGFGAGGWRAATAAPVVLVSPREGVEVTRRNDQPNMITYKNRSTTQEVDRASADAIAHLSYYWAHFEKPAADDASFTLKIAFPVTRAGQSGREHIWVSRVVATASGFSGLLDNEPVDIADKHIHDRVAFSREMITDWGFVSQGRLIGFYTTRAMLDDTDPAEAEKLRAMLGENPA